MTENKIVRIKHSCSPIHPPPSSCEHPLYLQPETHNPTQNHQLNYTADTMQTIPLSPQCKQSIKHSSRYPELMKPHTCSKQFLTIHKCCQCCNFFISSYTIVSWRQNLNRTWCLNDSKLNTRLAENKICGCEQNRKS